ncbi:winged helix-turn-helix domain-containing protein [Saccharothrix sp. AJ9571]|nr:winged helix-turn-helix domain-containing protein [Saccharothrix sp. AJ9571]
MEGRTEFRVLGPVEVRVGDRVSVVSGRMQRTLLGTLLARSNQLVTVDTLTDALWEGSRDPRTVRKLQVHVHRLRGVLDDPDRLSFNAVGYELRATADEVDAGRFDALLGTGLAAVSHEPQQAIGSLRAALALWRGTPFADLEARPLTDWSRRLLEQRLTATEALYQAQLNAGLHEAILGELTDFLAGHPLRERAHLLLMTALYHAGRRAEALDVYRRARHTLVGELGLEPGYELRELHRRVLDGVPPARPGFREVPGRLPADVHGFVGRQEELNELDGLVPDEVPVTISVVTGTAGVGKTALAVRWAHRARDRFPGGELYVDLRGYGPDTLVSPSDALAGILRALGVESAAIPEALAERAARFRSLVDGRRMLLLLDNARTAEQVRPLLPGAPSCFTVVTSRESLTGLVARDGAHRIRLHRLPPADAVSLVRGVLGSRADAQLAAVGILVERCARLPLALRIAAEQMRSQPDRAVCELGDELIERQHALDLLDVDGDPHTAVRAVFSWSYCRLEPAVARVFRLLGVHPGQDIDAHAAAAMTRAGLRDTGRALDVLVRAHLVDRTHARRYEPHDLLRAYAAELAEATDHPDERADALAGLRGYYLAAAAAAMNTMAPNEFASPATAVPVFDSYDSAFSWLNDERANLLAVTQHADAEYVVAMSQTIWRYLSSGKYHDDAISLHTHALHACRQLGDLPAQADTHRVLAGALFRVGLISEAVDQLEQAIKLYEKLGDRSLQAATPLIDPSQTGRNRNSGSAIGRSAAGW